MARHHDIGLIDQPDLYAYCYTGDNVWDEQHFLSFLSSELNQSICGDNFISVMDQACFSCLKPDAIF